tara:strand:+ start:2390 stop:2854 length:465 start_codon:yes stop_codon:yes gene_type:complete
MTTIVIFFVVGVLFIAAEVFLPGGIVGAIGGLVIIGGVVQAYSEFGAQGAFIAAIFAVLLLIAAFYIEFKVLPNTRMGSSLFLRDSVKAKTGYSLAADEIVGQICTTVTTMCPTGFVMVNGKKLEAFSKSGFIEKNTEVRVTGRDNFRILVSKI